MIPIPFIVVAIALIIVGGSVVLRRPLAFAALGPPLMAGSCALLGLSLVLWAVGISTIASSCLYLLLPYGEDHLSRIRRTSRERMAS